MSVAKLNLFSEVKPYLKLRHEVRAHLSKHPNDWAKFQGVFNSTLDKIYEDIVQFEKENIDRFESDVYRRKKIFEKRYRRYFIHGDFITRCLNKPFGYAGDFKIIDDIYQNEPQTTGFDRLWDNYFQQLSVSEATRERKEDLKDAIVSFVKNHAKQNIRIMCLASGAAREIKELIDNDRNKIFFKVIFDCYDFDSRALDYAKTLLSGADNVNFLQKNAIRLALGKNIKKEISQDYDVIYSTGLFDYLDERIATRLIANLKRFLKDSGIMIIANVGEKYSNSSVGWMEWVSDWNLVYRTEDEFRKIFLNAGFSSEDLRIVVQKSKIMQYCFAKMVNVKI